MAQAATGLTDEEFTFTVDEMTAVAQDEATIAMLTSMASEFGGGAPPAEVTPSRRCAFLRRASSADGARREPRARGAPSAIDHRRPDARYR